MEADFHCSWLGSAPRRALGRGLDGEVCVGRGGFGFDEVLGRDEKGGGVVVVVVVDGGVVVR